MTHSPDTTLPVQRGMRFILLLLSLISAPVLGNGVTVWDGDMPEDGLLIIPAEPQAFEPFTVVFTVEVPPGPVDHHAIHVDVIDHDALNNRLYGDNREAVANDLIITHRAKVSGASRLLPLAVEIQGLPPGNLTLKTVALDNVGNTSLSNERSLVIPDVAGAQEAFFMVTRDFEKYSLTASVEERDVMRHGPDLRNNDGAWQWLRGVLFLVWPAEGASPELAVPVCRFHSIGADSYFYTADEAECQSLQAAGSGWEFKGIEFKAIPAWNGACPAGTDPVWRLFNNSSDPQGINHRFTTLPWTYDSDVEKGWAGEGSVFCTPRSAPASRAVPQITIQPFYATSEAELSAILSGGAAYAPYRPSNSRVDRQPGEITIDSDFPDGGFAVSATYVDTIALGKLAPGEYRVAHVGHMDTTFRIEGESRFTVYEALPTTKAHTFFHPGINHYLVTAGEFERQAVLADGWHATDAGFNVWSSDGPAPRQAVPVCRFYSSLVNSHFYTASESECDYLQSFDSGWLYEGIAFQALIPRDDGVCPAGTQPVWRLFNNRHDQLDSNHRFVVGSETYRIMVADGWAGEGVAFCSPPASGPEAGQTPIGFVPG